MAEKFWSIWTWLIVEAKGEEGETNSVLYAPSNCVIEGKATPTFEVVREQPSHFMTAKGAPWKKPGKKNASG